MSRYTVENPGSAEYLQAQQKSYEVCIIIIIIVLYYIQSVFLSVLQQNILLMVKQNHLICPFVQYIFDTLQL